MQFRPNAPSEGGGVGRGESHCSQEIIVLPGPVTEERVRYPPETMAERLQKLSQKLELGFRHRRRGRRDRWGQTKKRTAKFVASKSKGFPVYVGVMCGNLVARQKKAREGIHISDAVEKNRAETRSRMRYTV